MNVNGKNNSSVDKLAQKAGAAVGSPPEELKKAAQSGDLKKIMSKLTPQQSEQLRKVLADGEAAKRLLDSPQAQALIKSLSKK